MTRTTIAARQDRRKKDKDWDQGSMDSQIDTISDDDMDLGDDDTSTDIKWNHLLTACALPVALPPLVPVFVMVLVCFKLCYSIGFRRLKMVGPTF